MSVISMKALLEAGVHFGHQTRRWNPKMKKFIFTERNGIYIIDLQQTVKRVDDAYNAIREIASEGGNILFVGTKKQAQDAVEYEAKRCDQYFVSQRWLGGMLTNYNTIKKSINRLEEIEVMAEDGTFDLLPKKEVIKLNRELEKLNKYLGGIKDMPGLPDALFVINPKNENIAIKEARRIGIPVIGICDTNANPDDLDFPIPGNDDAIRAVKLITAAMADAVIEGRQGESLDSEDFESQEEVSEVETESETETEQVDVNVEELKEDLQSESEEEAE